MKGFTLIELLVAMTIAAILISLSLVSFQGAKKTGRDGRRKADLEQIRSALEIYRSDCGEYPAVLPGTGEPLTGDCPETNTYLQEMPADPLSSYNYQYSNPSANTYVLCSFLEISQTTAYSDCGGDCGSACYYRATNP